MANSEELVVLAELVEGPAGDVQVFFDEHQTLILLSGEIDLALDSELEDAGRDAIDRGEPVRVNLSRVSFVDSTGIGFLARLASAGLGSDCPPVLVAASVRVRESILAAGLSGLVDWQDSDRQ